MSAKTLSFSISEPAAVIESVAVDQVVPQVEDYLRDFGLTNDNFVAIEARVLVGRAMSSNVHADDPADLLAEALDLAFEQRNEWERVARLEQQRSLWSGCEAVPVERRQKMTRQAFTPPPRLARGRYTQPATT